jgi:TonB family protein
VISAEATASALLLTPLLLWYVNKAVVDNLLLLTFLLGAAPRLLFATVSNADLQKEYGDKVLTLRHFYSGEHLRFDCSGKLIGSAPLGIWSVEGQIRVNRISLTEGAFHIYGARVFSFYDDQTKQMRDVASVSKAEAKRMHLRKDVAQWAVHDKVQVDIECSQALANLPEAAQIINTVFLTPHDKLSDFVPSFWKWWLDQNTDTQLKNPYGAIARVGAGVKPPRAISAPDPEYSGIAKVAHYQATTVLWIVINTSGVPEDIRISKPAGLGLDEQAILVVRNWRFDPATKDGQPVAVQINVEVNFKLY